MHGCDDTRHEEHDQIEDFFEDIDMAGNQGIVEPEPLQLPEKQNEGTYLESSRTVSETITANEGSSNILQLPSHDNSMSTSQTIGTISTKDNKRRWSKEEDE